MLRDIAELKNDMDRDYLDQFYRTYSPHVQTAGVLYFLLYNANKFTWT